MNTVSYREVQPSPGGWEAYRTTAFVIIEEQEHARDRKAEREQEVCDAKRCS